jgi:cysteine desulfurase
MTDSSKPVYLDHNASTPILPEVVDAMIPFLREYHGNPSSTHPYGQVLRKALAIAREQIASLIDANPDEVYFTSGGTEANNLAIRGVAEAIPDLRRVITSVIEHPAVLEPCAYLERQGYWVHHTPVDNTGRVMLEDIRGTLIGGPALVTIMHANSETGTLQPIREIASLAEQANALVHSDAAQSIGKVEVSVSSLKVDLLSIAGHKLYAPKGVGALYVKAGTPIKPLIRGAGHEKGLRPGTEDIASIVGLGKAAAVASSDLAEEGARVSRLRDRLWRHLQNGVPGIQLNGATNGRLPNTLNVRFPNTSGSTLLEACPGVAASTGSACHETGESPSAVIMAMGIPGAEAIGSVRLTLGRSSRSEEIDQAAQALIAAWRKLKPGGGGSPG